MGMPAHLVSVFSYVTLEALAQNFPEGNCFTLRVGAHPYLYSKYWGFVLLYFAVFPTDNEWFHQCRNDQKRGGTTSKTQRVGKRHLHRPLFLCLLWLFCLWLHLSVLSHSQHLSRYWPWTPLNTAYKAPVPSAPTTATSAPFASALYLP